MMCLKDSCFESWLLFHLLSKANLTFIDNKLYKLKIPDNYKVHLKIILCSISVVASDSFMKRNDGLDSLTRFLKLGET